MTSPLPQFDRQRILELADSLFDGSATPEQKRELDGLLGRDPSSRETYLRYALLHGHLTSLPATELAIDPSDAGPLHHSPEREPFRRRAIFPRGLLAAMTLSAIAMLVMFHSFDPWKLTLPHNDEENVAGADRREEESRLSRHYSQLTLPVETVATMGTDQVGPMTLNLEQGEARFAAHGGADVQVVGPALFGVSSRESGILFDGSVRARVDRPHSTFSVLTSEVRIVDLGTEFQVTRLDDQHVRVDVLDGEVEVQTRIRRPVYFWRFEGAAVDVGERRGADGPGVSLSPAVRRTSGIIGRGAVEFENVADAVVRIDEGLGETVGTGRFACTAGITIEAMILPQWSGAWLDYDEIFRKEDGAYRILLGFQNDGDVGDFDSPEVEPGPCLSFGLHIDRQGYGELDMPLDGREGRPTLANLKDGRPHHLAATYDSFTGRKALFVDGRECFSQTYPIGSIILSGGPAPVEIGNYNGNEPFQGVIDEVAFYDFALSAEEIAAHYLNAIKGLPYFGGENGDSPAGGWETVTHLMAGTQRIFDRRGLVSETLPE